MKILLSVLIVLLILSGVYLNRSYASFYNLIGERHLTSPFHQNTFLIENPPSVSKINKLETVRYVALGASLTAGVGATSYQNSFPYLVAQKLLSKSFEVTFEDFGVPGAESSNVLNYQLPKTILENPDYVSIEIGINDIHNLRSTSEYQNNMTQIIEDLKKKTHAKITIINNPLLGAENWGFPFNKLLDWHTRQFNEVLKNVASFENVKYIDLYSETKAQFINSKTLYSPDLFHPNDAGYKIWASLINVD